MAKNKIQFQEGFSIPEFIKKTELKNNVNMRSLKFVGPKVISVKDATMIPIVTFVQDVLFNALAVNFKLL